MKLLDFDTVKEICEELPPENFYNWVDEALRDKNNFVMPSKSRMNQAGGDYYAIMPCMHEKDNLAFVKMIGRHSIKRDEKRSIMMSDLLLYEADTGILKAVMDGEYLTTLRTGASAAHSVLLFGKCGFTTIGLIGLGNNMIICAQILFAKLRDRQLKVKLYKHHEQEIRFVERFKEYKNIEFVYCVSYDETIYGSDIVISAVTRVVDNFCADDKYIEGVTVIPVMTLGFQNCDLFFDKVFTDEIDQIRGFKYFDKFKSINNVTDVLLGNVKGRESNERIIVYNYGLAIHDLYFASKIYELSGADKEIDYHYCNQKFFV